MEYQVAVMDSEAFMEYQEACTEYQDGYMEHQAACMEYQ